MAIQNFQQQAQNAMQSGLRMGGALQNSMQLEEQKKQPDRDWILGANDLWPLFVAHEKYRAGTDPSIMHCMIRNS